jgi:hypothetical protein
MFKFRLLCITGNEAYGNLFVILRDASIVMNAPNLGILNLTFSYINCVA